MPVLLSPACDILSLHSQFSSLQFHSTEEPTNTILIKTSLRASLSSLLVLIFTSLFVVGTATVATAQSENKIDDTFLKNLQFRAIGPAIMGGRIDDIAVVESNPSTYYVGTATRGVWKTDNNGTTFDPIFDEQGSTSIADIANAHSDPSNV